jgi:hypothetical protein
MRRCHNEARMTGRHRLAGSIRGPGDAIIQAMDFLRAFKYAVVIALVVAGAWLFREDRVCRAEIAQRLGPTELVEHSFGSTKYDVVPESWKSAWRRGMPYPVVVTCWTDLGGTNFSKR